MSAFSNWTTLPQRCVPSAAGGIALTPSNATYVNSVYAQFTSGLPHRSALVGVSVNNATIVADYRLDIATGASGSEVLAATVANHIETSASFVFNELKTPVLVAANTPIRFRMRKSGTDTTQWSFKLVYYPFPESLPFFWRVQAPPDRRIQSQFNRGGGVFFGVYGPGSIPPPPQGEPRPRRRVGIHVWDWEWH